jgi:hypothetical protein
MPKIDWNEKLDGISVAELRDFIRRAVSNNELRITRLEGIIFREQRRALRQASGSDVLAIRQKVEKDCKHYLETLQKLEYIETITDPNFGNHYMQTVAGAAFAMASPKRFTRKAAQKQLDEFIRRCQKLNSQAPNIENPETICQVDSVIVYGSFATEGTTDVGDVDLCVRITIQDEVLYRKYGSMLFERFALADALNHAPESQAMKKLRKGLNILSIGTQLPEEVSGTTLLKRDETVS